MNNIYPLAYATYNNDFDIRMESTSGGVFSVIAEHIIKKYNGVVFGASFDEFYSVSHIEVDTVEALSRLRGSKYPQSRIGNIYEKVREQLNDGKIVLFVGTPCQVVALKNFLGTEYNNLWCMDFVCHGVASPLVWKEYVDYLKTKGKIDKITFKAKSRGWKKWYFKVDYLDHTWQRRGAMTEIMKSYLEYSNIRPSCFKCQFKGLERPSDFTISDCWGIAENNKEINDDKGLSALLIQNERALIFYNEVSQQLTSMKYDAQELMAGNWTTFKSITPNPNREEFFEKVELEGTIKALRHYFGLSIKDWIIYYIRRFKGKER